MIVLRNIRAVYAELIEVLTMLTHFIVKITD